MAIAIVCVLQKAYMFLSIITTMIVQLLQKGFLLLSDYGNNDSPCRPERLYVYVHYDNSDRLIVCVLQKRYKILSIMATVIACTPEGLSAPVH